MCGMWRVAYGVWRMQEDDVDTSMFEHAGDRLTARARQERDRTAAVSAAKKWTGATGRCSYCSDSSEFRKHLVIALGEKVCLMLPCEPLVEGHCLIVPMAHVASLTVADEEVWEEVVRFQRSLRRMFAGQQEPQRCLFLETVMGLSRQPHAVLECIPVPPEVEEDCPLYFKKELNDADEEWATHRKLISTTEKGLRRSVPPNFAYFYVEWEVGGYAHIIEDEDIFPRAFGLDTVSGMLGLDPQRFNRKDGRDKRGGRGTGGEGGGSQGARQFGREKQAVLSFLKDWEPHDWTAGLEGGEYE